MAQEVSSQQMMDRLTAEIEGHSKVHCGMCGCNKWIPSSINDAGIIEGWTCICCFEEYDILGTPLRWLET